MALTWFQSYLYKISAALLKSGFCFKFSVGKPGCLPYLTPLNPHEDRKMMMMMMILLHKIWLLPRVEHYPNFFEPAGSGIPDYFWSGTGRVFG